MATFHYRAKDDRGQAVSGHIEALSFQEAQQLLVQRGLELLEITTLAAPAEATGRREPLSAVEAEEVSSHLATLGASRLPLAAGLRAAAEDSESQRVSEALRGLAERAERGESLEKLVHDSPDVFPAHVGGLVIAASRTGRLGSALSELLEHQQSLHSLRQGILLSLAYPLVVTCLAIVVLGFGLSFVSVPFQRMFAEFELRLPYVTELLFWLRANGGFMLILAVVVLAGGALLVRSLLGHATWLRFLTTVPLFGPLWYWTGIAEWSSLLGVLLRYQIALPEALRLAASGVQHAYLSHVSLQLAEGSQRGQSLSDLLSSQRRLPASLVPLLRWGEQIGAMPDALAAVTELSSRRAMIRSTLLRSLLPPLLFMAIASAVLFVVVALFMPLMNLIQGLS